MGGKQACFPRTFEGHVDRPGQRKSSDRPLGELLPLSPQFSRVPALRLPEVLITQMEEEPGEEVWFRLVAHHWSPVTSPKSCRLLAFCPPPSIPLWMVQSFNDGGGGGGVSQLEFTP